MRDKFETASLIVKSYACCLLLFCVGAAAFGQVGDSGSILDSGRVSTYGDKTKAASVDKSRAEQEANRLVSLSADKIVALLTQEPGLFLKCKKLLVRIAFEEGRLIDEDDLTDDAV